LEPGTDADRATDAEEDGMKKASEWLGIDVGWVHPAADSDGQVYEWSRRRSHKDFNVAGPVKIIKGDGREFVHEPYSLAEFAKAVQTGNAAAVNGVAASIATKAKRTGRGIALENWGDFSRRKAAWIHVWHAIRTQADKRNLPVVEVNRAYTSLTCPKCGHKGRENRPTRDSFRCVSCGFSGQSDVVAAMNIAAKAGGVFVVVVPLCKVPVCGRDSWRAGLCSFCYRHKRNMGRMPLPWELEARDKDWADPRYREKRRREALRERRERRDAATTARLFESWATHDAWGNRLANPGSVT
jgi:predicted RNA-binding Zn-ribbon protein involved in translation (DUF1610 family)